MGSYKGSYLRLVRDKRRANVEVELDFQLVIKVTKGVLVVESGCPLFYMIASGCFKTSFLGVSHVLMKGNKCSDFIANEPWVKVELEHFDSRSSFGRFKESHST